MIQYHGLLLHILDNGEEHNDRTGVGTLSVFGYQIRFDLREGFPIVTTKRLPFRWIAEELFWFLRGSTYEPDLREKGVDIWKEWATKEQCLKFGRVEGDLGPVYGHLWRRFGSNYYKTPGTDWHGVDQIERLMGDLEGNPNSRRHLVTGWDPRECDNVALPPCHTIWQVKVHSDQYISLHLYARSIDSFLGLPFNIASYALLLHLIAAATGYEAKELIISFGDLHIYKNHMPQVHQLLAREPKDLPILTIAGCIGDTAFERLLNFKYSNLALKGYDPHPAIKADVAV